MSSVAVLTQESFAEHRSGLVPQQIKGDGRGGGVWAALTAVRSRTVPKPAAAALKESLDCGVWGGVLGVRAQTGTGCEWPS